MSGLTPAFKEPCQCGAPRRWEARLTPQGPMWCGLCIGLDCGEVTLQASHKDDKELELRHFLGVPSPRPYVKPWTRLFRRMSALPGILPLRSAEAACWWCEEPDLVMRIPFEGAERLFDGALCLLCGAVTVRCMPMDGGGPTNVYGGVDWERPDEAVLLLRRGLSSLTQAAENGDSDWPVSLG